MMYNLKYSRTFNNFHSFIVNILVYMHFNLVMVKKFLVENFMFCTMYGEISKLWSLLERGAWCLRECGTFSRLCAYQRKCDISGQSLAKYQRFGKPLRMLKIPGLRNDTVLREGYHQTRQICIVVGTDKQISSFVIAVTTHFLLS